MWGMTADELTGMKMSALYSKVNAEFIEREIIPTSTSKLWNGELTAVRKSGTEFPAVITMAPVHDEIGNTVAIVGVHRDITETKAMRDKLIRSERLAAVGEMASSVGHELRNPLNVIGNCTYLLRMMLAEKLNAETKGTLDLLDRQVTAANDIVTDLLDFTRIRPPALSITDINLLLKDALNTFNPPSRIKVITGFSEVAPLTLVDKGQAGRAFRNLIANAAQSIREEGEVSITSRINGDEIEVAVRDTGCGISAENMEKLFEPLFSTKPNGTGLGLAIAKKFIERNGGSIRVASRVNEGTTFTVSLPRAKANS
jgi:PAS domain S-box-containing protein